MLSLYPQDHTAVKFCHIPYRSLATSTFSEPSSFKSFNMGGVVHQPPTPQHEDCLDYEESMDTSSAHNQQNDPASPRSPHITLRAPADYHNLDPNTVAEALEIARDSAQGARDPIVSGILESALSQAWDRVTSDPETYVMTPGEFAVFNFYQQRFVGNKTAMAARARFWNNTHA